MKKRIAERPWFPFWVDKWIFGSMRIECTLEERAIWIDLLSLASKDDGYIRANEETPYPMKQLSGMLMIPEEKLENAIKKFIEKDKLAENSKGILYVRTWGKYQLSESYERVHKHRGRKKQDKTLQRNGKRYSDTNKNNNKNNNKKNNKNNNKKNKIKPNNTSSSTTQLKILFNFDQKKWENIKDEDIQGWKEAYPACDIKAELNKMREWLLANPEKRKKNYRRFITNWLVRAQDRGGTSVMTKDEKRKKDIEDWIKKKD